MTQTLLFVTHPKDAGVELWTEVLALMQSGLIYKTVTQLGADADKRPAIPSAEKVRLIPRSPPVKTKRPEWGTGASQPNDDLVL